MQNVMSALPPKRTLQCTRHVRFVPIADIAPYSITSSARREQRGRHGEAERLRGLEVDHHFVLGRRLHRQISWLLALEDAVDIAGRAPVLVDEIGAVGDQAALVTKRNVLSK